MAQTNYTPIQLYHSTTPSAVPNPANLTAGELAINTHDGILYFKDTGGAIQVLSTQSGAAANIAGGSVGALPYQTGVSSTGFVSLATPGDILIAGSSAPQYASPSTLTVGKATNIDGGASGSIPYQTAAGATTLLPAGTNGQVLTISGGVPTWATSGTATLASNLAGGAAGNIVYQTGLNTTGFTAAGTSGQLLSSNGTSAPSWVSPSSITVGTATSATNIAAGALGSIPYQTGVGATTFLSLGSTNYVLTAGVAAPQYVAQSTLNVGSATTATNIAGGVTGSVPYQTASGTTTLLAPGTNGYVLTMTAGAPAWAPAGLVTTATNLAGGSTGTIPYQTATGSTSFLSTGTAGQILVSSGASAPSWTNGSGIAVGTSTNLAGGSAGSIPYQTGSGLTSFVSPGTAGYVLTSNGASAPTWNVLNTVSLSANNTWTGTQTFTGSATAIAEKIKNAAELINVVGSAVPASGTLYASNGLVTYYTLPATGNFTFNFSFSPSTLLDSAMAIGESMTFVVLVRTALTTSYYAANPMIDGGASSATTVWLGSIPSSGSYGSHNIDAYTYTMIKTSTATFTVLAVQSQYIT